MSVKTQSEHNVHAVSRCKISVHQLVFSEVLHSFGNLQAHVNHPLLGFTHLHVCIDHSRYVLIILGAYVLWVVGNS